MEAASKPAATACYSKQLGTIYRKSGVGHLPPCPVRLGGSHLDQEPRRLFHGFRSSLTRLQALPSLLPSRLKNSLATKSTRRTNRFSTLCFLCLFVAVRLP